MKHVALFSYLTLSIFLLCSCKKNNADTEKDEAENPGSVSGSWELRVLYGGYRAPGASPYFAPGNGNIWKFTDSTYQYYGNRQLLCSGEYILGKDTSIATGRFMDYVILKQNYNEKIFFEIVKDILVFYRGQIASDGTIEKYVKSN
jgi:hypothetical protein